MELGKEAAEYVSKTFVKPIKLEFEKARPLHALQAPRTARHWHQIWCLLSQEQSLD